MYDEDILKKLRKITKNKDCWKYNIDFVANYLNKDYSVAVQAKALWLLGEMGLKHPGGIEMYVECIVSYFGSNNFKLR